ncbi:hypothetical protein [Halorussus marinus]|uniref:hypothetical protein n=1 Tax=Halorussus marinus TaxID=2505976 RepID=UPI001FD71978|nr:hypothetical protein [Halorussus marinus]
MNRLAPRATTLLVVVLLVASPMVGAIGTVGAQDAPDGFVGVPDTNIVEDLPVTENRSLTASDLKGSVMASDNASSLQVIVTTPERAGEYVNSSEVGASGDTALVFQDETNHAGREVAVPASAIREAVGHTPNVVHGVHESGESWTAQVEARNGLLIFEIPEFSANSVTFEGTVSITGDPAVDGSSYSVDVGNPSEVGNYHINVTGRETTEWDNASASGLANGDTLAVESAGHEVHGPAGGDPEVVLTGEGFETSETASASSVSPPHSTSLAVDGNLEPTGPSAGSEPVLEVTGYYQEFSHFSSNFDAKPILGNAYDNNLQIGGEVRLDSPPDTITDLRIGWGGYGASNVTANVYIVEETPDTDHGEGTLVKEGWSPSVQSSETIDIQDYQVGSGPITVEFETTGGGDSSTGAWEIQADDGASSTYLTTRTFTRDLYGDVTAINKPDISASANDGTSHDFGSFADGETATTEFDVSASATQLDFSGTGEFNYKLDYVDRSATQDPAVDLDGDGTNEVSHSGLLMDGETATYQASSLSPGDDTATISTAGGSTVGVDVRLKEVVETRDPSVEVNGRWANYTGSLAEGETAQLDTNTSWIQDGQNRINVSVGDGSLSSDAPTPAVGFDYRHSAEVQASTSYVANGWEESYEINHTFAGDREDMTVTIPFSRTIHDIRYVETSVTGGEWSNVSSDKWELTDGTTLTLEADDTDGDPGFEAGDELSVRTAGYKVQVENGEITVTDPTKPSDPSLDAGIRVDDVALGFHISVGDSYRGDRVHYVYDASWDEDDETILDADGNQALYLPDAVPGGTTRVTTIPMEVGLKSGDVGIHVSDPDTPEIEVGAGREDVGADVTYKWYPASSGTQYGLYSLSRTRYLDKQDAGDEFVALTDDDSEETLQIQRPGEDAGSGGGGGGDDSGLGSGGSWQTSGPDTTLQEFGVVAGWAGLVIVLIGATGRSELSGRRRWIIVGAIAGGTGLFSLEVLRPGAVSGAVESSLEEIIPLAGLAAIGIVGYSVFTWWQSRKAEASTPETQVNLEVGGGSD